MSSSGLSGRLYPIHLKPKDDELLSSWLVRLALAHGLTPTAFDSIINSSHHARVWQMQDVDLNIITTNLTPATSITALLVILSKKTATPLRRVNETTLDDYEERLYYKTIHTKEFSWIIPHDFRYPWGRHRFGMQACPQCLAEEEPYFRRIWRFAFVVACPHHECFLIDRCSNCGEPILFHRSASYMLHVPTKAMTSCYKCWLDLRDEVGQQSKTQITPEMEVLDLQKHLVRVAKQGYIKITGIEATPAKDYFDLLHWLLNTVIQPHTAIREIQSSIFTYYGFNFEIPEVLDYRTLQNLDVNNRYKLIWLLHRLLTEYPDKYLQFCSPDNLLRCLWLEKWRQNPVWYLSVMKAECSRLALTNEALLKNKPRRRNVMSYYEEEEQRIFGKSDSVIELEKEVTNFEELRHLAAQLYSEGIETLHVARILSAGHMTTWGWIKEHRASN